MYFKIGTEKFGNSEHAYNVLTPTAKWFSLPKTLLHVINLTDIMNYAFKKVKSLFPGTVI